MVETRSKKRKRQRLLQSYVPRRSDLPAIFESLNDDTLTTILQFVGNKCYRSFGGLNYHCREIYLSSGMTKKTFLFGYAPLSVIIDKIERAGYDWELYQRVGKGVVLYNRRDVFEWAVHEQNTKVLKGICNVAAEEGRTDILEEVWNNENDEGDKEYIFVSVDYHAACHGKLNVLKWYETKGLDINEYECAESAAYGGHVHILQWLIQEKGLRLYGYLYGSAAHGCHFDVMKWLRQQEVPWHEYNFPYAAQEGNLDILQWLHDEGCPWHRRLPVPEEDLKPEVIDWCRVNGYGNRIVSRGN